MPRKGHALRGIMLNPKLSAAVKETLAVALLVGYGQLGNAMTQAELAERIGTTRRAVVRHLAEAGEAAKLLYIPYKGYRGDKNVSPRRAEMESQKPERLPILTDHGPVGEVEPSRDEEHRRWWMIRDMMARSFPGGYEHGN